MDVTTITEKEREQNRTKKKNNQIKGRKKAKE